MDDPGVVGNLDGLGQGDDQLGGLAAGPGRAAEAVVEAAALEQLERDVGQALGLADVVDLDDVGMAEPGDGLGLDPEAGEMLGRAWLPPRIILIATGRFRPICRARKTTPMPPSPSFCRSS